MVEPCKRRQGQDTKGRISRPPAGVFHLQHWNVPFRDRMPHLGCRCEVKSSIVLLLVSSFTHFSIHPSISGFTTGTFTLKVFRTGFSCGSQYFGLLLLTRFTSIVSSWPRDGSRLSTWTRQLCKTQSAKMA